MATLDKDFKVKNGLQVTGDGNFGGTVSVATPTSNNHATTKEYVDNLVSSSGSSISVGSTAPENPSNGSLWLDTNIERVKIFYSGEWLTVANYSDTLVVQNHTHDPNTGFVTDSFLDGGSPSSIQYIVFDAGSESTTDWSSTLSGGIVA